MKKIVLISGATSGIGEATARILAQKDYGLILCGRRADRLSTLEAQLKLQTKVLTLNFDITNQGDVEAAVAQLPKEWRNIEVLINNAGNAHGLGPFQEGSLNDWETMIDLNVKGLLYLTKAILPLMLPQNKGHIINIGSVAGIQPYPNGNVYCASKAAVHSFTQCLRMDLHTKGIKVSEIKPGMVETEFSLVRFKGDEQRAQRVYEGYEPLRPQDVADLIAYMLEAPAHVNLADVLIFPAAQAASGMVHKTL
ncbi:MAG: SDR family NAD(P)-dependent oxidoreductase [Cytophagales bacterium]|nr:MAG: SDR family NAD(P)-dependent oxidoreductase [Cytophagales bacterium]TAF61335.1 MAG: SDR family NAD(P)-dependent oxidoreductase [Cytophagales bacterium]